MTNFKETSKKILTKVLFAFLVLSFVLFGISSFLLGGSTNWVAKIDGKKISYQSLEKSSNYEKQLILNRNPDNKNALNYVNSGKFKMDVLSKIINERLIESLSSRYGIYPDRIEILTNITKNPNFQKNGKFNHRQFKNILASNGIDEESYIKMISDETINAMTLNSITLVSPIDQIISNKISHFEEQIRYTNLITISQRNISKIKYPKDSDLLTIYEKNTAQFQEPQKRDVKYISFNKSALKKGVYITNKKVKEFYNLNEEKFKTSQTRDFYHISFDEKSNAEEFLEKLTESENKEKSFVELGKSLAKKSEKQLLIKNITAEESIPEVANKVFGLNLNQNSQIFESDLGYHIVLLKKITEGELLKFSKVRKEIKKQLQEKLVSKTINEKIDHINEFLISSNSLKLTTQKFALGKVKTIKNFTFSPSKNESFLAKRVRKLDQFTENSFKIEKGETSTLIENEDKLYVILVTKITDPRLKTFKEVKRELRSSYYKEKKEEKLINLAKKISEEVRQDPKKARKIARKYALKFEANKSFKRTKKIKIQGKEYETSTAFLEEIFDIKLNKSTNYHKTDNQKNYQIAVITKIKTPKLSFNQLNKYRSKLSNSYREGFVDNFNDYIEKEHNLIVNTKFIESLQRKPVSP